MNKTKIPKEIYNFISNAEYHLSAARALDSKKHIIDRIYILLVALENISLCEKIHFHWINDTKIPDEYFREHKLKLNGVRNPVIRIQFNKDKKKAKEIHYKSAKQLDKILNDFRYGPGKGAQSIQEYSEDNRWFDDEIEKEVVGRLKWIKLSLSLSKKCQKEKFA